MLAADGEHGAAAQMSLAAAERVDLAGSPVEGARCRIVAGRSFAQAGERDLAIALLEHAEEQLTLCGAFGFRDQAQKELRRMGRRVTRRSRPFERHLSHIYGKLGLSSRAGLAAAIAADPARA